MLKEEQRVLPKEEPKGLLKEESKEEQRVLPKEGPKEEQKDLLRLSDKLPNSLSQWVFP